MEDILNCFCEHLFLTIGEQITNVYKRVFPNCNKRLLHRWAT